MKKKSQMDPELASPDIKIEPVDTYIQKAVDLLKKINPSYFVGVRKIVADTGSGYGHVSSGPNQDPTVIHINLARIKSEMNTKLQNATQEQKDKEIVRQIALTISHEHGHVKSFKPEGGFIGGEGPAEAEEGSMQSKVDAYYNALK
jgi:2'-5' RNA ligase